MIEVSHLTKRYGDHVAVEDLTFTVEKGAVYGALFHGECQVLHRHMVPVSLCQVAHLYHTAASFYFRGLFYTHPCGCL